MTQSNRREAIQQIGGAMACSMTLGATLGRAHAAAKGKIKVGQIGVGHAHASGVMAAFRKSDDFEVVGVVEPNAELRRAAEGHSAYKDMPWMTREQLLNVSGLQGVMVETEVGDLLDSAEAAVAAGKHVHIDKPAGASLPQFRRILDSAARQKLLVQMGYVFRYNPAFALMHQFVEQGWLGDVFEVHAVMSKVVPANRRDAFAAYRGGILFELGGHLVDAVVRLLGEPEKVDPYVQHVAKVDDGLADNMLAVFTYPKSIASVKSSAVEVEGFGRRHFVACGTEGTMHIQPLDRPAAIVSFSKKRGKYKAGTQEVKFPPFARYQDDAAEMAAVIRGEKPSDFSRQHDLAVQTTLLKACDMPLD
jgi:predicted dehydrogenase